MGNKISKKDSIICSIMLIVIVICMTKSFCNSQAAREIRENASIYAATEFCHKGDTLTTLTGDFYLVNYDKYNFVWSVDDEDMVTLEYLNDGKIIAHVNQTNFEQTTTIRLTNKWGCGKAQRTGKLTIMAK